MLYFRSESVSSITVQNVSNEGPLFITQFNEEITPIRRIKHWAILRNDPKLGLVLPDKTKVFFPTARNVKNLTAPNNMANPRYKAPRNIPSFLFINGMLL